MSQLHDLHNAWCDKSLAELIELGKSRLADSSDSAKLDAQILLAFVLEKTTAYLFTWPEKIPTPEQASQYYQLIERRSKSEPVAYLVVEKEFWSLSFEVSPSTLIPRPDTEVLVEQVLELSETEHDKLTDPIRLLDLGTGTGAIALSIASEKPNWCIDAVDFNQDAVLLAKRNAQKLQLAHVNIFQSDWFSEIPAETRYNIIVSNPPYIEEDDQHLAQGDVQFEPLSALVAKNNGFADLIAIAQTAKEYFKSQGYLFLEHGYDQGEKVREILTEINYQKVKTIKDYGGNDRITWAYYHG